MALLIVGGIALAISLLLACARPRDEALRACFDPLEAGFWTGIGGILVVSWFAVGLGTAGAFSPSTVGAGCLATAGMIAWTLRGRPRPALRAGDRWDRGALLLLLACAGAWLRPHEYVLGGADAGTYVNVAANLARTGRLVVRDEWVDLASRHAWTSLRGQPVEQRPRRIQFVGWYVDDTDAARVLPQFLPLHPALLAVAIGAGGLRAGLHVVPLLSVLGVCGTYLLARRLFGGPTGLAAVAILAATPLMGFFSRYPTAEPLSLALAMAGLLGYLRLRDGAARPVLVGALAGGALGASALARIDVLPMLLLVVAGLVVEWRCGRWTRGWTAFAAALGALSMHAALHLWLLAWPYAWNVFEGPVRALLANRFARPAALALLLAAGGLASLRLLHSGRRDDRATSKDHLVAALLPGSTPRAAAAAAIVLASLWAWFLRPQQVPEWSLTWPSGAWFPLLDAQTWPRLGWYLTPPGIALATAGLAGLAWRGDLARAGLTVAVGSTAIALYVLRLMTTPYQIYAMRRFVPLALPALSIFAAVALRDLARTPGLPRARWIATGIGAALVAALLWRSREILPARDFAGAIDQVHALDAQLAPRAVVLFNERPEGLFTDTFGPPLRYVFDHPVVPVRGWDEQVTGLVEDVLARAKAEGRPVQLLAVDPILNTLRRRFDMKPAAFVPVRLTMMANTFDRYPGARSEAFYGIDVFDVGTDPPAPDGGPRQVDVGAVDTNGVVAGFHSKELLADGTTARWTSGDGFVGFPVARPGPVSVEIRARVFARPGDPAPEVAVSLDGRPIGRFRAEDGWRVFRFDGEAAPVRGFSFVRLEGPTFRPADDGRSTDERRLGVFVDRIGIGPR